MQSLDLRGFIISQCGPIKGGFFVYRVAKTGRVYKALIEFRSIDEQFFGHTTDIDTGSAQIASFDDCHPSRRANYDYFVSSPVIGVCVCVCARACVCVEGNRIW